MSRLCIKWVNYMLKRFKNKKGFILIIGLSLLLAVTLTIILGGLFVYKVDQEMLQKMQQKQMIQPTVFYSRAETWKIGDIFPIEDIKFALQKHLRPRSNEQRLFAGDLTSSVGPGCAGLLPPNTEIVPTDICLRIFWDKGNHPLFKEPFVETVWVDEFSHIKGIFNGETSIAVSEFAVQPQVVAQYLGGNPILREEHRLPEFPVACLNAIIAIEDAKFLEHKGVSFLGILRAVAVNLIKGRKAQGGSTLTQQLIKNYFLTPEKTLKRKALEFIMALLIESHFDKDLILETYLNIIYMGQQGPYEVRGYGAASKYYFQKSVSDLSLAQCSLLAAIVNSPGQFNPFVNIEKAKNRRALVLQKMEELKFISSDEKKQADSESLPKNENVDVYSTLPYFLQAAVDQAQKLGIENLNGHKIFTTMDLRLQESAQSAVANSLTEIEGSNPTVKKVREKKKISLESALVSVDIATGGIRAVVGGRSFKQTQFNRILNSKRQVGSTFKPIVYLTALSSDSEEMSPIYGLKDEPFTFQYGKQKWTPENYDHQSFGLVPLYFALKESLNLPTAKLAIDLGLASVIETARVLGIKSELKEVPSLSLGAFELNPLELLQAYLTIARFGSFLETSFIDYIEDAEGVQVWTALSRQAESKVSKVSTQILIGILKQTAVSGTAKRIVQSGFDKIVAGKTGTTNDYHDSWFVGFTPDLLTIVWTGFDDNTPTGLTGASGALPAWLAYMKDATKYHQIRDFPWTEDVETKTIETDSLKSEGFWTTKEVNEPDQINLIFKK